MNYQVFRLRPRYRALALSAVGVGGTLSAVSLAVLGAALLPFVTGLAGVALGGLYLLSPAWKWEVALDDEVFIMRSPTMIKFTLPWNKVKRVVLSTSGQTCFLDGGTAENSFIVPGDGMPAPYDIENKAALLKAILAHVPAEKVQTNDEVVG